MAILLAKSDPRETLKEHTENCLDVYNSLQKQMPFLAEVAENPAFFEHLFYAVALHDFGKAAVGFQKQLTDGKRWNYRHEILSGGFAVNLQFSEETKQAIALAILTHHKDIDTLWKKYPCIPDNEVGYQEWQRRVAELTPNWDALMELQEQVSHWFSRWCPAADYSWMPVPSLDQLISGYREYLASYILDFEDNDLSPLHSTYGMLMRGCMIACDHLASSSSSKNEIQTALENLETCLVKQIKQFESWEPFQKESGETTGQLMLSAPTGSGKTEAALLWSDKNQSETKGNRVFYVLPYTASINAMYDRLKDLVSEDKIGMLHGKANYFVYKALADKEYTYKEAAAEVKEQQNLTKKICRPYKVLTPF